MIVILCLALALRVEAFPTESKPLQAEASQAFGVDANGTAIATVKGPARGGKSKKGKKIKNTMKKSKTNKNTKTNSKTKSKTNKNTKQQRKKGKGSSPQIGRTQVSAPAAAAAAPPPAPLTAKERQDVLDIHNFYRCKHGADEVTWNSDVADGALEFTWNKNDINHENPETLQKIPAGENIGQLSNSREWLHVKIVQLWYNEIAMCSPSPEDFGDDGCNDFKKRTYHFTALIWAGVKSIGCAKNQAGDIFLCRYYSTAKPSADTANMANMFKRNVLPQESDPRISEGSCELTDPLSDQLGLNQPE